MTKKETIESRAEALVLPVLEKERLSLVDVEFVKEGGTFYLRYYIDKEGGVTIGDCETVSRAVSDLLDEDDFIDEAYVLEVSSPGIGRPIKKEKDFTRNLGKEIEVRLFKAVQGEKEFSGKLVSFDKEHLTIQSGSEPVSIERKNCSLIREYANYEGLPTKEEEDQK